MDTENLDNQEHSTSVETPTDALSSGVDHPSTDLTKEEKRRQREEARAKRKADREAEEPAVQEKKSASGEKETPEERRKRLEEAKAKRKAEREAAASGDPAAQEELKRRREEAEAKRKAAREAAGLSDKNESTTSETEKNSDKEEKSAPGEKETPEERRKRLEEAKAKRKAEREAAASGDPAAQEERKRRREEAEAKRKAAREAAGLSDKNESTTSDSGKNPDKEDKPSSKEAKPKHSASPKKEEKKSSGAPTLAPPEAVLTTLGNDGKRNWMYPALSSGRFWWKRRILAYTLISIFFALPLITIKGKPAVFIDIVRGEFTFFGLTLLRTDLLILMVGVMAFFVGIVYITALFGRVWCGWGCPQTVYMEFLFRPIERLIEGKAAQRKKRDQKGAFFDKAWRKTLKYIIYAIISVIMSNGFVAYFVSWKELSKWVTHVPDDHSGFFAMMLITAALIFFDFTYFREQMCTIACPYARIQSVLQDRNSMIVSFDPARGEPRGRRNRKQRENEDQGKDIGLGDCIDCKACVRTCPTGIDIRDGLQMECIGCTQCVDACEAIMISVNKPVGLIRYTSENDIDRKLVSDGRTPKYGKKEDIQPPAIIRPRTIFYSVILLFLVSTFVTLLVTRSPIEVAALRNNKRNLAPFTFVDKNTIANQVQFTLSNRTPKDLQFVIQIDQPKGATIRYPESQALVKAGKSIKIAAVVMAPRSVFKYGRADVVFRVTTVGHENEYHELENFALLGPD